MPLAAPADVYLQRPWLRLQRTVGNQAVTRLLEPPDSKESGAPAHHGALAVNERGDRFEMEADAVAEQVMRAPEPALRPVHEGAGGLQRKCSSCEEEEEAQKKVQRSSAGVDSGPEMAPASVHEVLRSPGRPLDSSARSFMEPRFGRDFSGVRIHTGAVADRAVRDVSAAAFTVGPDIAFASGRYAPETEAGRHLLAHELTHTVQQGHAAGLRPEALKVGRPDDPAEREAGAAAARAISPGGRMVPGVARALPC